MITLVNVVKDVNDIDLSQSEPILIHENIVKVLSSIEISR